MKLASMASALLVPTLVLGIAVPSQAQARGSSDARLQLASLQNALAADDRAAFDERLASLRSDADARSTSIVQELLPVYEVAQRLWDVQFETAFFSEDSDLYAQVSQYPGFAEALRRNVVTDSNGRRFFAAREAREFFANVARERLSRAGVSTAAMNRGGSVDPLVTAAPAAPRTLPARRTRRAKE